MNYLAEIARSIKRYEPDDKTALRQFQCTFFGEASRQCDDTYAEWLFERNPNRHPEGASLWLCKRDGVVVGQQGSIPVSLKIGDREHAAAWLIDWMVDPAWRLKGVAPALLAVNAQNNELMLGLALEGLPYRTVHRAGWQDVGRLSLFVRPLDPHASLQALNLPTALSLLMPRTVVGGSALIAARMSSLVSGVSTERIAAFDEDVDRVWDTAKDDYKIVVRRDYKTLRWRFDEIPQRDVYTRYYFRRKGEVIGYAVVRTANWRGRTIARVIDAFAQRRYLGPMFALLIEQMSRTDAIAVFFEQHLAGTDMILRSLGCFNIRPTHRQRFMYHLRDRESAVASDLANAPAWFVMPADADFDYNLMPTDGVLPDVMPATARPAPA